MAPTGIWDINKSYNGFKAFRVNEPPWINCWKKCVPCVESATARSTRCQFCNLGKRNCCQANHNFPDGPRRLWSSIKKGGIFWLEAPFDEPATSDATSGHSNFELNDQGIAKSSTRPSTLSSTSTNIKPPVARASRDPISPEPESIRDNHQRWNITGNFTDQKKVVTSLFSEVDALTEMFVDKAIKIAIPGEPTISLAKEAVAYEYALVVKFRKALKKF
ncbi:hypothetical protein O181_104262 [Austropuccinia psidii MF-1]|uniref:Uncharacterized protein n=1 Tax=Austropuccinia psidii MF-1 TaxID=1389203 RepID=A0A9Q3PL96_9BASI|nr:hypothetical protein [Austropuccinia psidii MF-1]